MRFPAYPALDIQADGDLSNSFSEIKNDSYDFHLPPISNEGLKA